MLVPKPREAKIVLPQIYRCLIRGAQWLSGGVLDLTEIQKSLVLASFEALCCVIEQDIYIIP